MGLAHLGAVALQLDARAGAERGSLQPGMFGFKKNPAAVLRGSRNRPVAVLNHNRLAIYTIEPQVFEAMMKEPANNDRHRKASARLADRSRAVEVSLDEL